MTLQFNYHLDLLKTQVLILAGLKNISPGDCRLISVKITQSTKKSISETTLKRVYGFAQSAFQPSSFTLDAMAKYCGYEGWKDFCNKQGAGNSTLEKDSTAYKQIVAAAGITGYIL